MASEEIIKVEIGIRSLQTITKVYHIFLTIVCLNKGLHVILCHIRSLSLPSQCIEHHLGRGEDLQRAIRGTEEEASLALRLGLSQAYPPTQVPVVPPLGMHEGMRSVGRGFR